MDKITGVSWSRDRQKWEAFITVKGKKYSLGRFANREEAIDIRKEADNNIDNFDTWINSIRRDRSIHIGDIKGTLKVLERLPDKISASGKPNTVYLCECIDCGEKRTALGGNLKTMKAGCNNCKNVYLNDLTDKVFDRLKVTGYNRKTRKWICECECKNVVELSTAQLTSGDNRSCGCLKEETQQANRSKGDELKVFGTNLGKIQSKELYKNNSSGVKGVHWSSSHKKWCAVINFQKKQYRLGYYDDFDRAKEIRKKAENKIFGAFIDWYEDFINTQNTNDHTTT